MYRIAPAADPADWIVAGIRGFAESVLSLVPAGFPAYVRIFHPPHPAGGRVTWAAIAQANGKRVHPGMQLGSIGAPDLENTCGGTLNRGTTAALIPALKRQTSTPDSCWFAVWEGHGRLAHHIASAPAFALPHRRYYLLTGPIDTALEDVCGGELGGYQSPNLWWPADRAWCAATEIDLQSTYLGCTPDCVADVVGAPGVEALPIAPDTGITYDSDALN